MIGPPGAGSRSGSGWCASSDPQDRAAPAHDRLRARPPARRPSFWCWRRAGESRSGTSLEPAREVHSGRYRPEGLRARPSARAGRDRLKRAVSAVPPAGIEPATPGLVTEPLIRLILQEKRSFSGACATVRAIVRTPARRDRAASDPAALGRHGDRRVGPPRGGRQYGPARRGPCPGRRVVGGPPIPTHAGGAGRKPPRAPLAAGSAADMGTGQLLQACEARPEPPPRRPHS